MSLGDRMINRRTRIRHRDFAAYARSRARILDIGLERVNEALIRQKEAGQVICGFDIIEHPLPAGYDNFVRGDLCEISRHFPNEDFDVVFAGEVIEHVTDPYRALAELHKILKPGGLLVISTPNPHGFPLLMIEWLGLKRFFYTPDHLFAFPARWFERMLVNCGFTVDKKYGRDWIFNVKVPVPLCHQMTFVCRKK